MDARSTPIINSEFSARKNSESSISSEDMLTSSEHLFSAHDTIDLSPDSKPVDKDYVRISKLEYEEIKNRVSAIENRLSREFTDVEPLQQVQNVYEQTLEEVAMLHCPSSDRLARRLSKELMIRPSEDNKIIRSPSARKIGSIRRRSKENVTKIVRHKSWNVSTQSHTNHTDAKIFYPYIGISRGKRNAEKVTQSKNKNSVQMANVSQSESTLDDPDSSKKYSLRKRSNVACNSDLNSTIRRPQTRKSFNTTTSSWEGTSSEISFNSSINSSNKSQSNSNVNDYTNENKHTVSRNKSPYIQQKWKNAATFFMEKTGEVDSKGQTGRPSVNKLRRQNAGAVLAKAKMFESSSDKSSELNNDKALHTGFARKPRVSGTCNNKTNSKAANIKTKTFINSTDLMPNVSTRLNRQTADAPTIPPRLYKQNNNIDTLRHTRKLTPPTKKVHSPSVNVQTPSNVAPLVRKPLVTPRSLRSPASTADHRKLNTPMRAIHISPRRRSPRQKAHRFN